MDIGPATLPTAPTPEFRRSVFADGHAEAERFKWIESEKAGRDLGEAAIHHWVRLHWWGYLRARWMEHLQGKCFWIELDRGDFGLLLRAFQDQKELLDHIVEMLKRNQENLNIIHWAVRNNQSCELVHQILEALDINSRRLICNFGHRSAAS